MLAVEGDYYTIKPLDCYPCCPEVLRYHKALLLHDRHN